MPRIKFGTSGWRAIISEDFTFDNVRLVVQAISDYIKQSSCLINNPTVIVGGDTRFLSDEFSKEAAKVLSSNGIKVLLCDRDVPTPAVAFHVIKEKCAGGINFTASHNPPYYNGIKFSSSNGGPATPDITKNIEHNITRLQRTNRKRIYTANEKLISVFNPKPSYLKQVEKVVDLKAIKRAKLKIAIDCLYGTSREYLDLILQKLRLKPIVLHNYLNPSFGGRRPEPARENIQELINIVKAKKLNLGLATDGDADRFGIIDSDGTYITPNEVITLLLYHLLNTRKLQPDSVVARSLATTHMIDMVAKEHGVEVIETPVGFKYFVDAIISGKCIIAGEESGGLSLSGHVPEKDGIVACLLIAEMVSKEKKPIKKILEKIYKKYGRLYSDKIDLEISSEKKFLLMKKLISGKINKFAGKKILKTDTRDGCKFYLEDGSWVLFRSSGTEPIVRNYFESSSQKTLKAIKAQCEKIMA